jgi:RimJ/RimL family protein N-acetyltransferase
MIPTLSTPRLTLRPLTHETLASDAAQVQQLFPHWEIVQHLNSHVPWPFPTDGVLAYYRDAALPGIERNEEWHWTLRLKAAPETIIGGIELNLGRDVNRGFWLAPPHQNQGLMTEAVVAVNDYWFDTLGFPILRTRKAIANTTSRRISEKTGMRIVSTSDSDYVSGRLPSETWEITAEEWRTWRNNHSS